MIFRDTIKYAGDQINVFKIAKISIIDEINIVNH